MKNPFYKIKNVIKKLNIQLNTQLLTHKQKNDLAEEIKSLEEDMEELQEINEQSEFPQNTSLNLARLSQYVTTIKQDIANIHEIITNALIPLFQVANVIEKIGSQLHHPLLTQNENKKLKQVIEEIEQEVEELEGNSRYRIPGNSKIVLNLICSRVLQIERHTAKMHTIITENLKCKKSVL